MNIEIHTIRSFPPSNLNRDQSGAPKTAIFGGVPRGRCSSQMIKRNARLHPLMRALDLTLMGDVSPIMTRYGEMVSFRANANRIAVTVAKIAGDALGMTPEEIASKVPFLSKYISSLTKGDKADKADKAENGGKGDSEESGDSKTLVLLDASEMSRFIKLAPAIMQGDLKKAKGRKKADEDDETDVSDFAEFLGPKSASISLFGRMLAARPDHNVDAALSVAHAISTHGIINEADEFTAINDLNDAIQTGAGHLDISEFNSATYYCFANLDMATLLYNRMRFSPETAVSEQTAIAEHVLRVIPYVTPTSRKTGTAPFTRPEAVVVGVRTKGQPLSLCNAFEKPIVPDNDNSISEQSVCSLLDHLDSIGSTFDQDSDVEWFVLVQKKSLYSNRSPIQNMKVFNVQSEFEKAVVESINRNVRS